MAKRSSRKKQSGLKSAEPTPRGASPGVQPPTNFLYVDAVARHGSIRKAADALHIASSALNRRILDLEEEVGTPLFERLPRGVRATAAGELFLAFVRRTLKELQIVEAQIEGLQGLSRGHVRIAVAESVTGRLLPDAIIDYQSHHPGIRFAVTVDGPRRLERALLKDQVDLILTHELSDSGDVDVVSSAPEPLCALVSPDHPLATRSRLKLRDCVGFPIAMPDETLAARGVLDAALRRASVSFEPALASNSIEMTKVFARASRGVCFSFRIGRKPDPSGMVAIPLADHGLEDTRLSLVARRGRVLPVAAAAFAEHLRGAFAEL